MRDPSAGRVLLRLRVRMQFSSVVLVECTGCLGPGMSQPRVIPIAVLCEVLCEGAEVCLSR